MTASWHISRRTMLRGVGTAIALPWLDAMAPLAWADQRGGKSPPKRFAVLYVPNGVHLPDWTPRKQGKLTANDLPESLQVVKDFVSDLSVLSGLTLNNARAGADGAGDHARAHASFLTTARARKTNGADIKIGISVDQVAAQHLGNKTRLPSLELACEKGKQAGSCDSGYSCAYQANLSWRSDATPMPPEADPKQVFERLFGAPKANALRRSVLDAALADARSLHNKLGRSDQRKLDEYLTSVRELERRVNNVAADRMTEIPTLSKPVGIPREYDEHIRLQLDLLVLAFQTDATRICTFALANEGSNRPYRFLDVPEGHHDLSHHGRDAEKQTKLAKINRFHLGRLAYVLGKLKEIREGSGTLLDNTMLIYGSGIGDGDRHNHDDLPILLCGRGTGTLNPGRHVVYPRETPLADLYVAILDRLGVPVKSFGDSRGMLNQL